ncbi:MAG: hypothetical protein VZR23_09565 [Lachnospiraceae bacterium]|nr:hypothetical protein [Lachnospiraceae bacterium]
MNYYKYIYRMLSAGMLLILFVCSLYINGAFTIAKASETAADVSAVVSGESAFADALSSSAASIAAGTNSAPFVSPVPGQLVKEPPQSGAHEWTYVKDPVCPLDSILFYFPGNTVLSETGYFYGYRDKKLCVCDSSFNIVNMTPFSEIDPVPLSVCGQTCFKVLYMDRGIYHITCLMRPDGNVVVGPDMGLEDIEAYRDSGVKADSDLLISRTGQVFVGSKKIKNRKYYCIIGPDGKVLSDLCFRSVEYFFTGGQYLNAADGAIHNDTYDGELGREIINNDPSTYLYLMRDRDKKFCLYRNSQVIYRFDDKKYNMKSGLSRDFLVKKDGKFYYMAYFLDGRVLAVDIQTGKAAGRRASFIDQQCFRTAHRRFLGSEFEKLSAKTPDIYEKYGKVYRINNYSTIELPLDITDTLDTSFYAIYVDGDLNEGGNLFAAPYMYIYDGAGRMILSGRVNIAPPENANKMSAAAALTDAFSLIDDSGAVWHASYNGLYYNFRRLFSVYEDRESFLKWYNGLSPVPGCIISNEAEVSDSYYSGGPDDSRIPCMVNYTYITSLPPYYSNNVSASALRADPARPFTIGVFIGKTCRNYEYASDKPFMPYYEQLQFGQEAANTYVSAGSCEIVTKWDNESFPGEVSPDNDQNIWIWDDDNAVRLAPDGTASVLSPAIDTGYTPLNRKSKFKPEKDLIKYNDGSVTGIFTHDSIVGLLPAGPDACLITERAMYTEEVGRDQYDRDVNYHALVDYVNNNVCNMDGKKLDTDLHMSQKKFDVIFSDDKYIYIANTKKNMNKISSGLSASHKKSYQYYYKALAENTCQAEVYDADFNYYGTVYADGARDFISNIDPETESPAFLMGYKHYIDPAFNIIRKVRKSGDEGRSLKNGIYYKDGLMLAPVDEGTDLIFMPDLKKVLLLDNNDPESLTGVHAYYKNYGSLRYVFKSDKVQAADISKIPRRALAAARKHHKGKSLSKKMAKKIAAGYIKKLNIPDRIKADGSFYDVQGVDSGFFKNASSLRYLKVGKNVYSFGSNSFTNCRKLKKIVFMGSGNIKFGYRAFHKLNKHCVISVPGGITKEDLRVIRSKFKGHKIIVRK